MQRVQAATSFASVLGLTVLGFAVPRIVAAAPSELGALAPYLDGNEPAVYLELFDLEAFERDLRDSGVARLGARFLPLLEGQLSEVELDGFEEAVEQLGFDPIDVLRGELSLEDALARNLYTLATEGLGVERDHALRLVASLGERFSLALEPDSSRVAVSWSLRGGGYAELEGYLDQHGPALAEQWTGTLARLDATAASSEGSAWVLEHEGERIYLALRPDLLALTNDRTWVEAVATGPARPRGSETSLIDARLEALLSGEPIWGWFDGRGLTAHAEGEGGRRFLEGLGLDGLESLQLSVGGAAGQFTSRLRVDLDERGRRGVFDLVRPDAGGLGQFATGAMLPADAMLVVGLADSPVAVGRRAAELMADLYGEASISGLDAFLGAVNEVPLVSELLEPGATGSEAVFFLRSGSAGLPTPYLVFPAEPALLERLAALDTEGTTAVQHRLRITELDGRPAWSVGSGLEGLALTQVGDAMVASQSAFALKDYLRALERGGSGSTGAMESVRGAIDLHSNHTRQLIGFAHVRVEPLAESVWPWMMMGLSASGAEGLDELPDAFEFAEEIGDTTLLLFQDASGLELRGRGLFGGLGVLF